MSETCRGHSWHKIIIKLFASSWYIFLTYLTFSSSVLSRTVRIKSACCNERLHRVASFRLNSLKKRLFCEKRPKDSHEFRENWFYENCNFIVGANEILSKFSIHFSFAVVRIRRWKWRRRCVRVLRSVQNLCLSFVQFSVVSFVKVGTRKAVLLLWMCECVNPRDVRKPRLDFNPVQ